MGKGGRMKWFKFVIYVQLFLAALASLGTAGLFAVEINDLNSVLDYYGLYYSELVTPIKNCITLDTVCIVVQVILAVFAIFVRFRLAKFRANGPSLYLTFLTATTVANLARTIVYVILCGQINAAMGYDAIPVDIAANISSLITSVALIILNRTYFRKRKELFIN